MAGYSYGESTFTDPTVMGNAIVSNFKNGNSIGWFETLLDVDGTTKRVILLKSTGAIDSVVTTDATQSYRLLITFTKTGTAYTEMTIHFGDSGQLVPNPGDTDVLIQQGTPVMTVFNNANRPSVNTEYNFRITLTDRGWALAVWPTARVNSRRNNFIGVMQRPVNPTNGEPNIGSAKPIFALWHGANSVENYFSWGVVREADVSASVANGTTDSVSRYNMYRISLDWSHPNLFDNNSHVVKFPYGLATRRHLYLDELDLICFVNAAAFASQQDVKITMYAEDSERKYKTTWGDVSYGDIIQSGQIYTQVPRVTAGTRLGILSENGGITTP